MYEVYRDIDSSKVGLINGILNNEGIETMLRNWNAGNITSVPIPEFYPNICVRKKEEIRLAKEIIDEYFNDKNENQPEWTCSNCGESVDGNFYECWNCQELKQETK